ncbi:dihydrofolate reductase-like domain-containing protein [Gorgonomyces haynaldii]|nr:dihydrofolate reductase-like domain-containing protein [Gorgonomyces haynaldii]
MNERAFDLIKQLSIEDQPDRPWVTLTFAQTMNGFISDGGRLQLSSPESMIMTHCLRSCHDGILVGIGTVLKDSPSLTTRLIDKDMNGDPVKHPRPVVIDPRLETPVDSKFMDRNPLLLTLCQDLARRKLYDGRAEIVDCPSVEGRISLPETLLLLKQRGINRLMVEGGAKVIQQFVHLQNALIITICPRYIPSGVHLSLDKHYSGSYLQFGPDIVFFVSSG